MATMKVIELMEDSEKSWEDAARQVVATASKTVKGIKSVWIKDQSCVVKNDKIAAFRVTCKVTFEVKD